jgi:hypothetical protein
MTRKKEAAKVSAEQAADFREKQKQALARKMGRLVYAQVARRASMMYLAQLASGTTNELTPLYNRARMQLQIDFDVAIDQIAEVRQEWVDRCMGRDPEEIDFISPNVAWFGGCLQERLAWALTGR